jgi:transcriptional regulator with XRE-family HTH domain
MLIGDRLRAIREAKGLSQGDIEERSGLKRAYISRIEHGHTVPSWERHWKSCRGRLRFRFISCSTKGKSRPSCSIFLNARPRRNRLGQFRQRRAHSEQVPPAVQPHG